MILMFKAQSNMNLNSSYIFFTLSPNSGPRPWYHAVFWTHKFYFIWLYFILIFAYLSYTLLFPQMYVFLRSPNVCLLLIFAFLQAYCSRKSFISKFTMRFIFCTKCHISGLSVHLLMMHINM